MKNWTCSIVQFTLLAVLMGAMLSAGVRLRQHGVSLRKVVDMQVGLVTSAEQRGELNNNPYLNARLHSDGRYAQVMERYGLLLMLLTILPALLGVSICRKLRSSVATPANNK